jgi:hypothetical protein
MLGEKMIGSRRQKAVDRRAMRVWANGRKKEGGKNSSIYLYDEWAWEEKNSSHFLTNVGIGT